MTNMKEKEISSFLKVVGDTPKTRVMDFLLMYDEFDYSLTEIARNAGISYVTLMSIWKDLEDREIVELTRVVGKAKLYRLNKKNPIVKELLRLDWIISKREVHKMLKPMKAMA